MPICDAATTHEFEVWRFWSDATGNDNNKKSFLPFWFSVLNSHLSGVWPRKPLLHVGCMKVNNQHFPLLRKYKYPHFNNFVQLFHSFLPMQKIGMFQFHSQFCSNNIFAFLGEIWSLYLSFDRIHSEVEVAQNKNLLSSLKKDCKVNKECFPLSIPFIWSAQFTVGGVSFFTWPNHENFLENSNTWEKPQTMLGTWASYSKYFIFC